MIRHCQLNESEGLRESKNGREKKRGEKENEKKRKGRNLSNWREK